MCHAAKPIEAQISRIQTLSIRGPSFYNDLKKIFGANNVWTKLQIDSELTLPYALKIDLETGDFLPISKEPTAEENADKVL